MSCSKIYLIIYVATTFLYCLHFSMAGSNETDRLALLEIKAKIRDDPLSVTRSWNNTLHFCHWFGVTCSHRHQRVTVLNLQSSKLTGIISPHIGNLSFLKELYMQNNTFSGTIPPEIGKLNRLQYLWLNNNSIEGRIPTNISSCLNLLDLDLGHNMLVGHIPSGFSLLLHLQYLDFGNNNYSSTIPSFLGNISSLKQLFLQKKLLGWKYTRKLR
jgi:Leucine-rich repeat (LRR) protein